MTVAYITPNFYNTCIVIEKCEHVCVFFNINKERKSYVSVGWQTRDENCK